MAKAKPNLGWIPAGWETPFAFSSAVRDELGELLPSVSIKRLESQIADYLSTREILKNKPTSAEQKENLKLFEAALQQCLLLMGKKGLDQPLKSKIRTQLTLSANPEVWSRCEDDLRVLQKNVFVVQRSFDGLKGRRPRNNLHRDLAQQLFNILEDSGIKATSTQTGPFCALLEIVLREVGEPKQDVHKLARLIVKRSKNTRS